MPNFHEYVGKDVLAMKRSTFDIDQQNQIDCSRIDYALTKKEYSYRDPQENDNKVTKRMNFAEPIHQMDSNAHMGLQGGLQIPCSWLRSKTARPKTPARYSSATNSNV